jgi:hypothetical protein
MVDPEPSKQAHDGEQCSEEQNGDGLGSAQQNPSSQREGPYV